MSTTGMSITTLSLIRLQVTKVLRWRELGAKGLVMKLMRFKMTLIWYWHFLVRSKIIKMHLTSTSEIVRVEVLTRLEHLVWEILMLREKVILVLVQE